MFRHPRTAWHYINACLRKSGKVNDGIRVVRGLSEVNHQQKNRIEGISTFSFKAQDTLR